MTRLMLTLWLYSLEFVDDRVDVDPVVVLTSVCRQPGLMLILMVVLT